MKNSQGLHSVTTMQVKTALLATLAIKSFGIQVETRIIGAQPGGFVNNQGRIDFAQGFQRATQVGHHTSITQ